MDVSDLLDPLNDAQRDAVPAPPGPVLVIAGAGSGKTRVLVHRIAWQIRVEGASPYGVLAVTFTNKAAAEMRGRTEQLLGIPVGGMWVGTFHSLAHRLLRMHWREAELPQTFQILDADDQYRLIRRLLKALELDEAKWPPRQVQGYINGRKEEGLRPQHIDARGDLYTAQMLKIYQAYEDNCRRAGLVDFAELLLRAHELLRDRPEILAHYCQPVRGRRRRSVDLRLARRAHRKHPALQQRFPRHASPASRRELPLDPHHPRSGECADRSQQRPARQGTVDPRRAGRTDPALRRVQRIRRGALHRRAHPALGGSRPAPQSGGDTLSF